MGSANFTIFVRIASTSKSVLCTLEFDFMYCMSFTKTDSSQYSSNNITCTFNIISVIMSLPSL